LSMGAAVAVVFDPTKDKSYAATRLGRSVVDYLAWKKRAGTAERTRYDKERYLGALALLFPDKEPADLEATEIIHLFDRFAESEYRQIRSHLNNFFEWAWTLDLVPQNPMRKIPKARPRKQRYIDTFTDAEVETLTGLPLLDGTLMQILFDAGIRKGEARRLRFRDYKPDATVDAPHGKLIILQGKGGKDRVVPATAAVARKVSELQLLEAPRPNDHLWYAVFANAASSRIRRDQPVGEGTFHRWWGRCLDQAGIPYRNPHTSRHTFATRWLRRGGRLTTLSLVMGHSSIRVTFDLYGHLDTRDVAADLALIESGG
jgi:integrase